MIEGDKEIQFPGNSIRSRQEKEEQIPSDNGEKKIPKIVTGKVKRKKKTFTNKLTGIFFNEDVKNVASYVVYDVLIPALKDTIVDMVKNGVEMAFYGNETPHREGYNVRRDKGSRSIVSYNKFYRNENDRRPPVRSSLTQRERASHDFGGLIIASRHEAEEVLAILVEAIETYGSVSVADFYDAIGIETNFSDTKYGWTNLSRAYVDTIRGGYRIFLPKPSLLE
jgi:hypothetical protein